MSQAETPEILITADAHVGETEALRERMPAEFREYLPRFGVGPNGELTFEINGHTTVFQAVRDATHADLEREFRSDPSLGTDLDVRRQHMLRERLEELNTVVGMAAGMAPIVELTGSGVLERHPGLRFVVTESECGWLAWTLQAMDQMQQRRSLGMRKLPMRASDYFRRQGAVTISDDPVALNNLEFTGADCLLWGNDYPHDEGTWPNSAARLGQIRKRLSAEDARKVLGGNAARLYGFDLAYLASHQVEHRSAAAP